MEGDSAMLERWQAGDRSAGEALYRRWVGHLTRFFRNKVSDDAEVPDLVSQSFLALTQAKESFRGEASFRRLLFSVASNVFATHLRKRYKRVREVDDFAQICIATVTPHGPSSLMAQDRGRRAFLEGLRALPLDDQVLLELRYFEGLTGPELAEIQDVPEGTVRGRISRATARLVAAVRERLGDALEARAAPSVDDRALEAWAHEVRVQFGRDQHD